jgi:hypothetical protein
MPVGLWRRGVTSQYQVLQSSEETSLNLTGYFSCGLKQLIIAAVFNKKDLLNNPE